MPFRQTRISSRNLRANLQPATCRSHGRTSCCGGKILVAQNQRPRAGQLLAQLSLHPSSRLSLPCGSTPILHWCSSEDSGLLIGKMGSLDFGRASLLSSARDSLIDGCLQAHDPTSLQISLASGRRGIETPRQPLSISGLSANAITPAIDHNGGPGRVRAEGNATMLR
jgi:hypothetical protein